MSKYKNTILIVIACILLAYAAFISIVPAIMSKSFNIYKFEEKFFKATSLITTFDDIQYKIKPNFQTIIILKNLSVKYIDQQPLFDARYVELTTTPSALLGSNFVIKKLYLKNVNYEDQILPNKENKLAFLPASFDSTHFGKSSITITSGPVEVKNFNIKYIGPSSYKERHMREAVYDRAEVRDFLSSFYFSHVIIK